MKKIKKKIIKKLSEKVPLKNTLIYSLIILVIVLGIICIIKTPFRKYSYVDLNNNWGNSYKCYKYKNRLVCEVRKEVKKYYAK